MSELSKLIKINQNIEKQNEEIIRLLKIIAGENQTSENNNDEISQDCLIKDSLGVGEIYFFDNDELFKLSIKNNEIMIDNLIGVGESNDFNAALCVVNESIRKNQSLNESICILNDSSKGKLHNALKLIVEKGFKKVFIPWNQSMELIGAPQELQFLIKLDLYKSNEDLIEKIFG